jgi:hypothetical protein
MQKGRRKGKAKKEEEEVENGGKSDFHLESEKEDGAERFFFFK